MSARTNRRQTRGHLLRQLPFFLWLIVVWMALWGQLNGLVLITGVLVALFVVRAFYLPPAEAPARFNPYRFAILLSRFVFDLALASFGVSWQAVRPRPIGASSIIQVDLRTRSDLIMTLTAVAITLIPGSFVLEADRTSTTLYLHVLGATTIGEGEKMRATVFALEERIIRALGTADDVLRVQRWHEDNPDNGRQSRALLRPRKSE